MLGLKTAPATFGLRADSEVQMAPAPTVSILLISLFAGELWLKIHTLTQLVIWKQTYGLLRKGKCVTTGSHWEPSPPGHTSPKYPMPSGSGAQGSEKEAIMGLDHFAKSLRWKLRGKNVRIWRTEGRWEEA